MPKITVSTRPPCERRFHAGLAFGPEPREVEVSDVQLAAIKSDVRLQMHKPAKKAETKTETPPAPDKGEDNADTMPSVKPDAKDDAKNDTESEKK